MREQRGGQIRSDVERQVEQPPRLRLWIVLVEVSEEGGVGEML